MKKPDREQRRLMIRYKKEIEDLVAQFFFTCSGQTDRDMRSTYIAFNFAWQRTVNKVNASNKKALLYPDAFEKCVKDHGQFIKDNNLVRQRVKDEALRIMAQCTNPVGWWERLKYWVWDLFTPKKGSGIPGMTPSKVPPPPSKKLPSV